MGSATIKFSPTAKKEYVKQYALDVIIDILTKSNNVNCLITSTARTPYDQARIMFDNCELKGSMAQLKLYKEAGQQVVKVYMNRGIDNRESTIAKMEAKILEIGASHVSRHCADFNKLCVVDIAPSSISNKSGFIAETLLDKRVSKLLHPPTDPAFHLEIPIK